MVLSIVELNVDLEIFGNGGASTDLSLSFDGVFSQPVPIGALQFSTSTESECLIVSVESCGSTVEGEFGIRLGPVIPVCWLEVADDSNSDIKQVFVVGRVALNFLGVVHRLTRESYVDDYRFYLFHPDDVAVFFEVVQSKCIGVIGLEKQFIDKFPFGNMVHLRDVGNDFFTGD
ncbi:MAG: hypothetical protein GY861_21760 [bacterium]|nr:hypothetical protein [bacterium]